MKQQKGSREDQHHRAVTRYDEPITLPSLDMTEHDLSVRWEREEEREFLPAMLSCRERQLSEALKEIAEWRKRFADTLKP